MAYLRNINCILHRADVEKDRETKRERYEKRELQGPIIWHRGERLIVDFTKQIQRKTEKQRERERDRKRENYRVL